MAYPMETLTVVPVMSTIFRRGAALVIRTGDSGQEPPVPFRHPARATVG